MGAPITIKKRSVTIKKSAPAASKPAEPEEVAEAVESENTEGAPVFVSKPTPTGGKGKTAPPTFTTVAAIFAVIATIIFLFVILIQWTELRELDQLFPQTLGVVSNILPAPW